MGFVAKEIQEKRKEKNIDFFKFLGKVCWEENEEHD